MALDQLAAMTKRGVPINSRRERGCFPTNVGKHFRSETEIREVIRCIVFFGSEVLTAQMVMMMGLAGVGDTPPDHGLWECVTKAAAAAGKKA